MSHSEAKQHLKVQALVDALFEEACNVSVQEVREDLESLGRNPEKVAEASRSVAMDLLMRSRRNRLERAQNQLHLSGSDKMPIVQYSANRIRQKLRQLVSMGQSIGNGRVALAFRNGVAQSDNDLLTLWQDLIELGAVSDDDLLD